MTAAARTPRLVGRALVAAILLTFALEATFTARSCESYRPPRTGQRAPTFALPSIDASGAIVASQVALESFRGKVVVLDFWATWCLPCRQSMPALAQATDPHGEEVVVLSVATDGTSVPKRARELVDQLIPNAVLVADGGEVADTYGVTVIPHIVVVGREGEVVASLRGVTSASGLQRSLTKAISVALEAN